MAGITIQECKAYLGIDYADEYVNTNLERNISAADKFLQGAIGKNYPKDDPRAKELALMVVADLYDNRSYSSKTEGTIKKITKDFATQLRIELINNEN